MKRVLVFLIILTTAYCLFAPQTVLAKDEIASSEEVYGSTPSGDMSRIFLGQIFGAIDHSGLTGSGSLMPAVFKAFNTAALGIGAIIVMFSLIVSTLNTAHQGEILGQQWSTMWVPFRIIMGIGILVPTGAGYTLLQSFIMWSVLQGIGAANYVWQQAIDAVSPSDSDTMVERGWIMAGAYYYDLTEKLSSDDVLGEIKETIQFNFAGLGTDGKSGDPDADQSIQMGLSEISSSLNGAVSTWMHLFTMREGDPLLSIQKTGQEILATVEILWIGIAIIAAAIGIASVCAGVNPIFNMLQNFIAWLVPLFTALLIFLYLSAALLAYYIPLIPFILFSLGGIGWLMGIIEAIAASPLIALGIMNPHGNDPYFGRSEPSLLLLLDIVIRPSMMIIGMMAAMVMVRIAVPFINMGFGITGQNVYAGGISFLTSIIAMIVVYCSIIVIVVQKCFSLIHYVPDKVMRWIGGMPNAFESGAQEEKEIKGGFEKGMQPFGELGGQAATSKASMKMATTGFGAYGEMEKAQRQGLSTSQGGPQDGGDSTPGDGDDDGGGGGDGDDDSPLKDEGKKQKSGKEQGSRGTSQTGTSGASGGSDDGTTPTGGGDDTGAKGGSATETTGATGGGPVNFGDMMSKAWSDAKANIAKGGSGQFSAVFGPTAASLGNSFGGSASSAASSVSDTISSAMSSLSSGDTASAQASISQAMQQANTGMSQVANQAADSISAGMDSLRETMADAPAAAQEAASSMGDQMNAAVSNAVGSARNSITSNLTKASNALTSGGRNAAERANEFLAQAQAASNPQKLGTSIQEGIIDAVKKADG